MTTLIIVAIIIILVVKYNNSQSKKRITEANEIAVSDMPIVKQIPTSIHLCGLLSENLLTERLKEIYPNFAYFEKWDKSSFILCPYQKVRVYLTNGGYEDAEVYFSLNEKNIPVDVEITSQSIKKEEIQSSEEDTIKPDLTPEDESEEAKWYASNISKIEKKAENAKMNNRCSFIYSENLDNQDIPTLISYIVRVSEFDCSACKKGIRFRLV